MTPPPAAPDPGRSPRVLIAAGMLLGAAGMAYLTQVTVASGYASAVLLPCSSSAWASA